MPPHKLHLSPFFPLALAWLCSFPAGFAGAQSAQAVFPIVSDTYLDSAPANANLNFGSNDSVRVLVNGSDGSLCRGLFRLPPEVLDYSPDRIVRAQVCFYLFSDRTEGRNVSLFPLARPFDEYAATWFSADGSNAWASAGGDFDPNFSAVASRGADGFFRWDVTDLLLSPSARSNLLAHGALLRIDEDPMPSGMPRAPFTSSDSANVGLRPFVRMDTRADLLVLPIPADTYLDSHANFSSRNFGSADTVKVLVNSSVSGDGSICRGLVRLPEELAWFDPGDVLEACLRLYVWQDNTGDRGISLFPLLRPFVEGSGNGDGASWLTSDGSNAWSSAGGDFDSAFSVAAVKEDVIDPDVNDRFFSWNLLPLLANGSARSNLLANGALLRIDESPSPLSGTPRAPFTSAEGFYPAEFLPHLRLKVSPKTPSVQSFSISGTNLAVAAAPCTPLVSNRLEWTPDLSISNGWTYVASGSSVGTDAVWLASIPLPETNGFFRIRIPEQATP